MIYPHNFEEKIDFLHIKEAIKELCISPHGATYVDKIRLSSHPEKIKKWQKQVSEFKDILLYGEPFPEQNYYDLTDELRRIRIQGSFIEQDHLTALYLSLQTIESIGAYFKKLPEGQAPQLNALADNLEFDSAVLQKAARIIDSRGEIKDQASPELANLRQQLRQSKNAVDGTLNKTLQEAKKAGWANREVTPTVRSGRSVIPIPATHKRQVKGFIHDESSTGQTVYIEPTAVFELNNRIRELENAERRGIIRILTIFTDELRPDIENYLNLYRFLGLFDFIRAKAKYAIETESVQPLITDEPYIYLENAHHPLLFLNYKKQNKSVVPLNVKLDKRERILVITGPNAGGKTVGLKTVGLIQYMFQCGLLVPAHSNSKLGIFKDIFVNIGDEQSLENDLSTYSSHLQHLNFFIRKVKKTSLFLIDEFGTGTEPQLGGAIAEAVLESLNSKGAFGIITTHYANLKKLADEQEGMMNGAMLFDAQEMKPVFILKTGTPGSSFAFEIAEKIGIPKNILNKAEKKINKSQVTFDKQLQALELEKRNIEKKSQELKGADSHLSEMIDKYEKREEELKSNKNKILREARAEAKEILSNANRVIENTIREIKENKADKTKTLQARSRLEKEKQALTREMPEEQAIESHKPPKANPGKVTVGSFVTLKGQEAVGEVTAIDKEKVTIAFESFNFSTTLQNVELTQKSTRHKRPKNASGYTTIMDNINTKASEFSRTLDVRGKKAEEVHNQTQQYLDEALLLGINEVEIIHGKGEGILRAVVRDVLSANPNIKDYRDQHADSGGHGVTVVRLK